MCRPLSRLIAIAVRKRILVYAKAYRGPLINRARCSPLLETLLRGIRASCVFLHNRRRSGESIERGTVGDARRGAQRCVEVDLERGGRKLGRGMSK